MKLLILAYDFPPFISIGGLRPYSWYKYLPDFGVDVTVVTRDWEAEHEGISKANSSLEQTAHRKLVKAVVHEGIKETLSANLSAGYLRRLRQIVTYSFGYLEYISTIFDSKSALYFEADKLMQTEKFDLILATGKPFILFRYAAMLSKKHKTPWVADYRDSWTMNHDQGQYSLSFLESLLNGFYKMIERKYVSTASLITTVAPSYVDVMPPFFSRDKIKIVYNGYDNDVEKEVEGIEPPKTKLVISYAGHIYPMQRLEVFLDAAALFVKENEVPEKEFEIHFWGIENDPSAIARIRNNNPEIQKYIHLHNKTGYFEVMKQISNSHILLLLTSNSDTWLNAKLFDYLALKRPVLMIGTKTNVMREILDATNGGVVAQNAAEAAKFIATKFKVYHEAKAHDTINHQQYSRRNQAEKLSLILKNLK